MIEIRSLEPFCPVLATCEPGSVDAVLASLGRKRDAVVIVAAPTISALEKAEAERDEAQERANDLETEVGDLEKQLRDTRAEAAFAKADLNDKELKRRALEREVKDLRAKLGRQMELTGAA